MSFKFNMPKAGLTMVEGTISEWFVNEGDTVNKGDIVLSYENEKTVIDCECPESGIIHILTEPGDTIKVGDPVAVIAENMEEYNTLLISAPSSAASSETAEDTETKQEEVAKPSETVSETKASGARVKATGLARKIASNEGIDLHDVNGTGPNGRIVAKDVTDYSQKAAVAPVAAAKGREASAPSEEPVLIPMSGARKAIANNLRNSISTMVQASSSTEMDVTDLFELRAKLVAQKEKIGIKITINDLLVMAAVKVLAKHPLLNATFDGEVVTSYPHVNINIAVGAESGLAIPVVKNCELKTLSELSTALRDVAVRARNGELKPGEQSGGYFTISNVGMYPIDHGSPIANAPQVGLFAFGRTLDRREMRDGEIVVRKKMHVMFVFDHRVFDGLEQGRILSDLQLYLEHPELMLI